MQKAQASLQKKKQPVYCKATDEKILVVKKNILFAYQAIEGLKPVDFDRYQKLIKQNKKFLWRSKMEENPEYKQIIPYLIFTHDNKYFVMRRKSTASEARLQNKFSIGIGGHIRKEDIKRTNIIGWAEREFKEEVKYRGTYTITPLGILNDESDSVGQVHTGFVFLLEGSCGNIEIRDEHKEGSLMTLDECFALFSQMESWSKIVLKCLKEQTTKN